MLLGQRECVYRKAGSTSTNARPLESIKCHLASRPLSALASV
jgi:hypothetical protein